MIGGFTIFHIITLTVIRIYIPRFTPAFYLKKNFDKIFIVMNKKNMKLIAKTISEKYGISFVDLLNILGFPRTTLMRKIRDLITVGVVHSKMESNQLSALTINPDLENIVVVG